MSKIMSILLHVSATNPTTRQAKAVLARFDGQGNAVDSKGNVLAGFPKFVMPALTTSAPAFPQDEFQAAVASGDVDQVQAIQAAFSEAVAVWQKSQSGGTREVQLARAAVNYLVANEGFKEEDGDWFVIKLENLDVQVLETKEGEQHVTIGGTAVFG